MFPGIFFSNFSPNSHLQSNRWFPFGRLVLFLLLTCHQQMTKLSYTHLLHDNSYDFFLVFSLPRGRKRRKPYASSASYPSNRAGWGWGCSWLGSPLFSVFANARAGSGSRGQPLHMTNYTYLTSYPQCPHEFLSQI
jgi:hypothetical protein